MDKDYLNEEISKYIVRIWCCSEGKAYFISNINLGSFHLYVIMRHFS